MAENISNNRRIAKNTLMLYLRMVLILAVTLYTSRVVLRTLGIPDFGVYTIVGGFVSMLAYLNAVFVSATQRFMSFELGRGDKDKISATFATAKLTHIIIAILILIVAETFGLWFLNNRLVIDAGRMYAANWVYQCSVVSLLVTIISIPYNSCIIAHEHMQVYAAVSILEVILKLLILYLLVVVSGDKLIIYALLQVVVSLIIRFCYTFYCSKHFEECRVKPSVDKALLREMSSYAGWTALGSLGFTFKDQFSNVIFNSFFGTTINAARGIAMQVNSAITSFATNFFMAISPQITKQYAVGNLDQSQKLVYAGARYSFYLLCLFVVPVIINIDYILTLWLGTVPEYTASFIIITLLSSLIYSLTNSTTTALQATGNIKIFQIGVSIIMLLELPISYVILRKGYSPYYALLPMIATNAIALIFRFYLLRKMIPSYNIKEYYVNTVLKCIAILIICFIPSFCLKKFLPDNFMGFCVNVISSVSLVCLVIYCIGISVKEREIIQKVLKTKLSMK